MAKYTPNAPIKDEWHFLSGGPENKFKELPGYRSVFHWHCKRRMVRIIRYLQEGKSNPVRKIGLVGYMCEVCEIREELPVEFT